MTTPPSTAFDFLSTGIWVGWSFVVWSAVCAFDRGATARRGRATVAVLAASLLVGLVLLLFTLLRWGYLDPLLGYDGPVYRRGLPFIGIDLLGLLVLLDGVRRMEPTEE